MCIRDRRDAERDVVHRRRAVGRHLEAGRECVAATDKQTADLRRDLRFVLAAFVAESLPSQQGLVERHGFLVAGDAVRDVVEILRLEASRLEGKRRVELSVRRGRAAVVAVSVRDPEIHAVRILQVEGAIVVALVFRDRVETARLERCLDLLFVPGGDAPRETVPGSAAAVDERHAGRLAGRKLHSAATACSAGRATTPGAAATTAARRVARGATTTAASTTSAATRAASRRGVALSL